MTHDAHDWEKAYRGGVTPSRIKREPDDVLAKKAASIEHSATEKQCRTDELENLRGLLGMCYGKLIKFGVENSDPLLMDEIKLELMK